MRDCRWCSAYLLNAKCVSLMLRRFVKPFFNTAYATLLHNRHLIQSYQCPAYYSPRQPSPFHAPLCLTHAMPLLSTPLPTHAHLDHVLHAPITSNLRPSISSPIRRNLFFPRRGGQRGGCCFPQPERNAITAVLIRFIHMEIYGVGKEIHTCAALPGNIC